MSTVSPNNPVLRARRILGPMESGSAEKIEALSRLKTAILSRSKVARAVAFEREFPSFLSAMASSIRAGMDPVPALHSARALYSVHGELGRELAATCEKLDLGYPEEEAILEFGSTIGHPDTKLFCLAFLLSRKQGSSLAPSLGRLLKVIRQRQSFRRKAAASIATQRMSTMGIGGCSIAIGLMQYCLSPNGVAAAWSNPLGFRLLVVGALLMFIGLVWMLRLGRLRL